MITTIENAANLRIADNQFWELAEPVEFDFDVIDPETGIIRETVTAFPDAALWIDDAEDDNIVVARMDQYGDRFRGILRAELDTKVRLVGN